MIVLLSPAKTLDFSPTDINTYEQPRLLSESEKLINVLRKKSPRSLKKLMSVSDKIAQLNAERYASYQTPFQPGNAKQAILAFKGDVYLGLEADTFEDNDLEFAQQHVRILSGLYGILTPMDLIHPYRLEMGTSLKMGRKKNLYEFWGDKITTLINDDLSAQKSKHIINLASKEYFHAVNTKKLKGDLIHIHFQELRNGKLMFISFNAKKARGAMTRQIILERLNDPEDLKDLIVDDYTFNASLSGDQDFYFTK